MTNLLILIPAALFLGCLGLVAFIWALRTNQYEDLDGAALRILDDDFDADPDPKNARPSHAEDPVDPTV